MRNNAVRYFLHCWDEYWLNTRQIGHGVSATELFVQWYVQVSKEGNINATHYWPFGRGIHQWLENFRQNVPVMWRRFPCHRAIIVSHDKPLLYLHTCKYALVIWSVNSNTAVIHNVYRRHTNTEFVKVKTIWKYRPRLKHHSCVHKVCFL